MTPKLEPACKTSRFPQSKRGERATSRISKLSAQLLVSPEPLCCTLPGVDAASRTASHNKGGLNWTQRSRKLPAAHGRKQFGGPDVQKGREFTFRPGLMGEPGPFLPWRRPSEASMGLRAI